MTWADFATDINTAYIMASAILIVMAIIYHANKVGRIEEAKKKKQKK